VILADASAWRGVRRDWQAHALERHLARNGNRAHPLEGDLGRHQLPANHTEAPQVTLVRVPVAEQNLRRCPLHGPNARVCFGVRALASEPEVGHLDFEVGRDE